jgi:hypothetical protein
VQTSKEQREEIRAMVSEHRRMTNEGLPSSGIVIGPTWLTALVEDAELCARYEQLTDEIRKAAIGDSP